MLAFADSAVAAGGHAQGSAGNARDAKPAPITAHIGTRSYHAGVLRLQSDALCADGFA